MKKTPEVKKEKAFAFTLAETLVTLIVIGIVAVLTIPPLIQNNQTLTYKTAYKQAYSDINQAFFEAINMGDLTRTSKYNSTATEQEFNILKEKFKVAKECKSGDLYSCWAKGDTVCVGTCSNPNGTGEGQPKPSSKSFIDSSGRSWAEFSTNENMFLVDTNGFKGPNKFGQDRFMFVPVDKNSKRTDNYSSNPPVKVNPYLFSDYTTKNNFCQYPPCYYKSWLLE